MGRETMRVRRLLVASLLGAGLALGSGAIALPATAAGCALSDVGLGDGVVPAGTTVSLGGGHHAVCLNTGDWQFI
jgi:hypothetical protein